MNLSYIIIGYRCDYLNTLEYFKYFGASFFSWFV